MKSGFIYAMSNDSMLSLLKIGGTERHPEKRARELRSTGVPTPFVVEFAVFVDDWKSREREVHDSLGKAREDIGREFFRIDIQGAVKVILAKALYRFDVTAVDADLAISEVDAFLIAGKLGKFPAIVPQLIGEVPDNAWSFALQARNARKLERIAKDG